MATELSSNPRKGFFIEVGCPGCGGRLEINSNFFVTSCTHCGTPLRLVLPETTPAYILPNKLAQQETRFKIDRYLKSKGLPLTGSSLHFKQIYYPYWKIEATLLRCRNRKEKIAIQIDDSSGEEIVDYQKNSMVNIVPYHLTIAAGVHLDGVPESIGIRGQSLKAVPLKSSRENDEFEILEVRRSQEEVLQSIRLSLGRMNSFELAEFGENLTKLYNPTTSLIFFPFCLVEDYEGEGYRRYVIDGLSGRIVSKFDSLQGGPHEALQADAIETNDEFKIEFSENADDAIYSAVKFGAVEVQYHRCDVCGVDLPARPSCIYMCSNCHELTCLDKNIQTIPKILAVESKDLEAMYFPFWSYQTDRGRYFGSLHETDRILIPAFNIPNYEAMYRLTCRVTSAASKLDFQPIDDLNELFASVDIFPSAGTALANVVFYRHELEKKKRLPAQELKLSSNDLALCFIPFRSENYFFVDSALNGISFEKKLVNG